jgi:hypothetical protein
MKAMPSTLPKAMSDRKPSARHRNDAPPIPPRCRSQRDLVAASLLRSPAALRQWDERTRLEYESRSR